MENKGLSEVKLGNKFKGFIREQAIFLILIVLIAIMSIVRTDTFFTVPNLLNILRQVTVLGIVSCGATMVLIGGNLDISMGSTLSLCMVVSMLMQPKGLIISISLTILAGMTVGFINGFIVGKLGANSLIVTLGMMSVVQGVALVVSGGMNILGDPNSPYSFIGKGNIFSIPFPVYLLLIIAIITHFLLSRTLYGRSLYITGGNSYAALASGINTSTVKMISFIILGLYCAIGAIISSSLVDSAQPTAGKGFEFDILTAVILGGTSLYGGIGNITNTILGVLLLGVIGNSMTMLGLPFSYKLAIKGAILIIAVYYDVYSRGERG